MLSKGSWVLLGLLSAGVAVACSAGTETTDETDDGSAVTTTGAGGIGGAGGASTSTGSGGDLGACGTDCSMINTPQCQVAQCNTQTGMCEVVNDEDGVACDDGLFCTISDSCSAGSCTGGPQNDCGMTPPQCTEVSCDETSQTCSTAPSANGAMCQDPNDLCLKGSTCSNGLCIGGTPDDCFFFPVPTDCHVATCDPVDGMCKPEPGNTGQPCSDVNDLCTINKVCDNMGMCIGGDPKNCSHLTVDCTLGVCDTITGQCTTQAVGNGQPCDDLDGCTVGEICTNNTCGGGTSITQCINNDGCCPNGCDLNNDDDCGCHLGLIAEDQQFSMNPPITTLMANEGHTFVLHENNTGQHSSNASLLNQYDVVVFHTHDRVISSAEMNALNNWILAGGSLLVTGYDSLGSPTDANLANVVNCTAPGDGPFGSALLVSNASHPIMLGPAQQFTLNMSLTAASTDHDQCTPGSGAVRLVEVSGSSKLQVSNKGSGKVVYWNGNGSVSGPLVDWDGNSGGSQPALQNLLVNVLDFLCQ